MAWHKPDLSEHWECCIQPMVHMSFYNGYRTAIAAMRKCADEQGDESIRDCADMLEIAIEGLDGGG
jgi:hypothetical protein